MEPIEFFAGNENRFFDFIRRMNDADKIALISHTDLDGVASAKIISEVVGPGFLRFVDYIDVNEELVRDLRGRGVNKIIFVDVSIHKAGIIKELEEFAEILIIDHHLFSENLNSDKTVFLSTAGYCSSYICYYLFSKLKNIGRFDWLVAAASLSDFCYKKNAHWLSIVMEKYGEKFDVYERTKLNRIYDISLKLSLTLVYFRGKVFEVYEMIGSNIHDIGNLDNYARDVMNEIERSELMFEKEKKSFNKGDGYFWDFSPEFLIKSILVNRLGMKHRNKTLVLIEHNKGYYDVSARREDGKVNLVEFLKKLTDGLDATAGGHNFAAGATIMPKSIPEFMERVRKLQ